MKSVPPAVAGGSKWRSEDLHWYLVLRNDLVSGATHPLSQVVLTH
jgi:hypothetical protein